MLLFVHGYNNGYRTARESYRSFEANLLRNRPLVSILVRFYWPGDSDFGLLQKLSFVTYAQQIPKAKESAAKLADFLRRLDPSTQVSIVAHSLGSRLLAELLEELNGEGPTIFFVALLAAALPVQMVREGGFLRAGLERAQRSTVMFSGRDNVLRIAFPAGQEQAYALGYEVRPYHSAVGLHGEPSWRNSTKRELSVRWYVINSHSMYWASKETADTVAGRLDSAVPRRIEERARPVWNSPTAKLESRRTSTRSLREHSLGGWGA